MFRDFPTFLCTCILSLLIFSISDLLPSDFLLVLASSCLCFSICPYCRKFSFQTSFDNLWWFTVLKNGDVTKGSSHEVCLGLCSNFNRNNPRNRGLPSQDYSLLSKWDDPTSNKQKRIDSLKQKMNALMYERRTNLLIPRSGHGQSGWSLIGCEGLYFLGGPL